MRSLCLGSIPGRRGLVGSRSPVPRCGAAWRTEPSRRVADRAPALSVFALSFHNFSLQRKCVKIVRLVRPVAQLVEHRTPNLLPVRARVRDASALDKHIEPPDGDGLRSGSGRSQLKSVSGADRVRLCGHVKISLLNSADYQEYPDRKVGARACATSSAYCGLCPRPSFHSKVSD